MGGTGGKKSMTGTRDDVQLKVIEFIYSLKYYSTRWQRANMYSELVGFIQPADKPDDSELPPRTHAPSESLLQHGIDDHQLDDLEIPKNDIYSQEFFLYAYSMLTKDPKNFVESEEGSTYLRAQIEERMQQKIFGFLYELKEAKMKAWKETLLNKRKGIQLSKGEDHETAFYDFDMIMGNYMEEFRSSRKEMSTRIRESIVKKNIELIKMKKEISIIDIKEILKDIQPLKPPATAVSYAGDFIFTRAFLYALVSGENSGSIRPN